MLARWGDSHRHFYSFFGIELRHEADSQKLRYGEQQQIAGSIGRQCKQFAT
jgi:hypothetical protein